MLTACAPDSNLQLERIDRLSENNPRLAREALDSIDRKSLASPDRHLYDLLDIKIDDKNYVTHKSDSIILDVVDYYSSLKNSPRYPEALYYTGRVYSDMGDSHTALSYYRLVIDLIRQNDSNIPLKTVVLSQTAWLLSNIRLYDEAVPYLREAITLEKAAKDSIGLSLDLQILGGIFMNQERFDLAEKNYQLAKDIAIGKDKGQESMLDVSLSSVNYVKGNHREALNIIRKVLAKDSVPDTNYVFSWAAKIYAQCGYLDSAYIYADKLVHSPTPSHKRSGYELLLSDSMSETTPTDSLLPYIYQYRDVLEKYYESHSDILATEQQANYNYSIHQRERENAEDEKELWETFSFIAVFIAFATGIVFLWNSNKHKQDIIRLQKANADMDALLHNLKAGDTSSHIVPSESPMPQKNEDLRENLKSKIRKLQQAGNKNIETPASIRNSASYKSVLKMLDEGHVINVDSTLWGALERTVISTSPNFRNNLSLLVGREVSRMELNIALLIKCGFTPMKIANIIGKEKGTVSYYRQKWSKNIFGENIGNESMDNIIRML